jgi:hypothetical protein
MSSRVSQVFQSFARENQQNQPFISEHRAEQLISAAKFDNLDNIHFCGAIPSHKGSRELKRIFKHYQDAFTPQATLEMKNWMSHGWGRADRWQPSFRSGA